MKLKQAPQFLKVKEIDRENYRVRFILSTGSKDRHDEVIDQKGWRLDNYRKNPVVLWGHDQSRFPIGRCEEIEVVNENGTDQLEAWVVFAYKQNPEAATCFELVAADFLNAGSVGFMNLKWMFDEESEILTLLENELYEFSIVNVPANPEALAKAAETLKEKGVDKRVIETIDGLRKAAEERKAARFEGLGDQVKEAPETAAVETEAGDEEEEDKEPEVETETADEAVEQAAKAAEAIEVLCGMPANVIKAAVSKLTKATKDADKEVEPTPAQGRAANKKKIRTHAINRVIRNMIAAEDN